jgi:O-antigen ligase
MYYEISGDAIKNNEESFIKTNDIVFATIMAIISITLYVCLVQYTSIYLVMIAIPLCLYDRSFVFPMLLTVALCQGVFEESEVTTNGPTQNTDWSESLILAAVSPMLLYDLVRDKISRVVPYRFVIFFVIFAYFIVQGVIIYYQHPENYQALIQIHAKWSPITHSIMKCIKVTFYVFFIRVLMNNPLQKNLRTLEVTRRFVPFILIVLGINLYFHGRAQSGAGYQDTLQLGDAHHGSFTTQLCAFSIYCFITFFRQKATLATRGFALVALAAVGFAILEMGSRNGLLTFGLVCILGFILNMWGKSLDYKTLWTVLAFSGALLTFAVALNSPTVQRAIYMTEVEDGGDRVYYWEAGFETLKAHPIFGMGGDESASQAAVAKYAPAGTDDKVMHNTYLEMAVEYGLFGFFFYLALVLFTFFWGYKLFRYALANGNLLIAAPPISYFILMTGAFFVSDVWDTSIWYNQAMIFALAIQLVYYPYINKKKIDTKATFGQYFSGIYN